MTDDAARPVKKKTTHGAQVSLADLLDEEGKYKRPSDLPALVRKELKAFSVGKDGRIKTFTFRDRFRFRRAPSVRKGKPFTKAMEKDLLRKLDEEIERLKRKSP